MSSFKWFVIMRFTGGSVHAVREDLPRCDAVAFDRFDTERPQSQGRMAGSRPEGRRHDPSINSENRDPPAGRPLQEPPIQ